jgi:hypothetical protein
MKTVFKDEHKLKQEVESHISEEKEVCGCGCEIGKCECGPECTKCDCGKKEEEETSEDWNPNDSVATQPGGLMQGAMEPKWLNETKNNFKRLIR